MMCLWMYLKGKCAILLNKNATSESKVVTHWCDVQWVVRERKEEEEFEKQICLVSINYNIKHVATEIERKREKKIVKYYATT